jgi:hypothetical protein
LVAAVLLVGCHGGRPRPQTLTLRVQGNPDRGSASGCVFVIRATVVGGGTQTTCLTDVNGVPGPNAVMHSAGTMRFELPRGRIDARVRVTQRFGADGEHARQATAGTITGGSGSYAGATGTVTGQGTVDDRFAGLGPVRLVYVLALRPA